MIILFFYFVTLLLCGEIMGKYIGYIRVSTDKQNFELQKDRDMREWVKKEKARLAAKMMEEKKKGMPLATPVKQSQRHWHCDDIVVYE